MRLVPAVEPERPRRPSRRRIPVTSPGIDREAAIYEATVACLTLPYDRELVRCVSGGGSGAACFAAFRTRSAELEAEFQDD